MIFIRGGETLSIPVAFQTLRMRRRKWKSLFGFHWKTLDDVNSSVNLWQERDDNRQRARCNQFNRRECVHNCIRKYGRHFPNRTQYHVHVIQNWVGNLPSFCSRFFSWVKNLNWCVLSTIPCSVWQRNVRKVCEPIGLDELYDLAINAAFYQYRRAFNLDERNIVKCMK